MHTNEPAAQSTSTGRMVGGRLGALIVSVLVIALATASVLSFRRAEGLAIQREAAEELADGRADLLEESRRETTALRDSLADAESSRDAALQDVDTLNDEVRRLELELESEAVPVAEPPSADASGYVFRDTYGFRNDEPHPVTGIITAIEVSGQVAREFVESLRGGLAASFFSGSNEEELIESGLQVCVELTTADAATLDDVDAYEMEMIATMAAAGVDRGTAEAAVGLLVGAAVDHLCTNHDHDGMAPVAGSETGHEDDRPAVTEQEQVQILYPLNTAINRSTDVYVLQAPDGCRIGEERLHGEEKTLTGTIRNQTSEVVDIRVEVAYLSDGIKVSEGHEFEYDIPAAGGITFDATDYGRTEDLTFDACSVVIEIEPAR